MSHMTKTKIPTEGGKYPKISLLEQFFGKNHQLTGTPLPNINYIKQRILEIDTNIINAIQNPNNKRKISPGNILRGTGFGGAVPDKTFEVSKGKKATPQSQTHDDTYGSVRALDVLKQSSDYLLKWTALRQIYLQRLNVRNARIFNVASLAKGIIPLLSDNWAAKISSFTEIRRPFGVIPYEDTVAKTFGQEGTFSEGPLGKLPVIGSLLQRQLKGNVYQSQGLVDGNKVEYKIFDPIKMLGGKINDFIAAKFGKDTDDASFDIKKRGLEAILTVHNVYSPFKKETIITPDYTRMLDPIKPKQITVRETGFEYNEAYEAGGPGTSEIINGRIAKYKITFDPSLTNAAESPDNIFKPGITMVDVNDPKIEKRGFSQRTKNRDFVGDRIRNIDKFVPRVKDVGDNTIAGKEKITLDEALTSNLSIPFYFTDYRIKGSYCFFNAILDGLSETYTPNWSETDYFGRSEGIAIYGNTKRNVSLQFKIVVNNPDELDIAYEKLNWLTQRVYPEYNNVEDADGNAITFEAALTKPPLVTIRLGDLITSKKNPLTGLGGFISSLTYSYPQEMGWEIESNRKVPKAIDISMEFSVLHDTVPGFETKFYGITPQRG